MRSALLQLLQQRGLWDPHPEGREAHRDARGDLVGAAMPRPPLQARHLMPGSMARAKPSPGRGPASEMRQAKNPLLCRGRPSPRHPRRFAKPTNPFLGCRLAYAARNACASGSNAPFTLVTGKFKELPAHQLAKRAGKLSRYFAPRTVINATGGPLGHFVSWIDDSALDSLNAMRKGEDPCLRQWSSIYFNHRSKFKSWATRVLDKVVGRWLQEIKHAQRVCWLVDSNGVDDIVAGCASGELTADS